MKRNLLITLAMAMFVAPLSADEAYDWSIWKSIVVQDGGRMKPLDTLATEFTVGVVGRGSFTPDSVGTFSIADVSDWTKLAELIKTPGDSPARQRVVGMLSSDLKASVANLNLDTSGLRKKIADLRASLVSLREESSSASDHLLTFEEWKETVEDPKAIEMIAAFEAASTELQTVDSCKAKIILELNGLLGRADLYDPAAWKLDEQRESIRGTLQKGVKTLSKFDLARVNNSLIESAFDKLITSADFHSGSTIEPRRYSATELYVTWLLTWQGWDKLDQFTLDGQERDDQIYWRLHNASAWDAVPMLDARYHTLQPRLKPEIEKGVSIRTLAANKEFEDWVMELVARRKSNQGELSPTEEKAVNLFEAYMNFCQHRLGYNLHVGPNQSRDTEDWLPLVALIVDNPKAQSFGYPTDKLDSLREAFHQARTGLLKKEPAQFNAGSKNFAAILADLGRSSHIYPTASAIQREVHYNKLQPFLWTTVLAALSSVVLGVSLGVRRAALYHAGFAALVGAMGMMAYGMLLRVAISGRGPVTNMYETIIWSSFVAAVIAVAIGTIYRQRIMPTTAAIVLLLATLLAHIMPISMGASITPLQPVLRSNYWLVVHVMTIVASYGAFMLAWALGNVGLGYYIAGKEDPQIIKPMVLFTYRAMQVGLLLLITGTILGGWWAAESWGRFWGWDPKEVWALIAAVGYLAILHSRFVGWVRHFGLLAGAVVGFSGIIMAWYGVNFVLGAGLHAYAFGDGGQPYVLTAVAANLVYVAAAAMLHHSRNASHQAGSDAELAATG